MLQLVKLKKSFGMRPFMRFLYSFSVIFSILLCATFYVLFYVDFWSMPTQDVVIPEESEAPPVPVETPSPPEEVEEEPYSYGDIRMPSMELYQQMQAAYESNEDTIGWLSIPNTNISYPVMQYIDNEFYLKRDHQSKRYRFAGSIFADFRNRGITREDLSKNYVIYGHNINIYHNSVSGDMFAQLMYFKELEFAQENQYVYFSTFEDEMTWEIFACFYTDVDFYYIDVDPGNEEVFTQLVEEARLRSEYIYEVEVVPEDKIITLSTCTYKYDTDEEQRFVVMARLVPENRDGLVREVTLNPSPKQPSFVGEEGE